MTAALILAAGAGSRFHRSRPKQLARLRGRPLLQHVLDVTQTAQQLDRVVVVLGYRAAEVRDRLRLGCAQAVVCPDWQLGQAASLRCGVRALSDRERVMVLLGDQPLLTPAIIARMAAQPPRARAMYHGTPGHPVVLGPRELDAVGALSGDRGARSLLAGGRRVECGGLGSGQDVDTPADLAALAKLAPG